MWETYNTSEATYVWRLRAGGNAEEQSEVEGHVEKIKWLRQKNKKTFLKEKPQGFLRIEHDYNGEDMGFEKWKATLNAFLL